jgi:hypothetical protein
MKGMNDKWIYQKTQAGTATWMEERRVVRPERFELPAFWFVAKRSIQLS